MKIFKCDQCGHLMENSDDMIVIGSSDGNSFRLIDGLVSKGRLMDRYYDLHFCSRGCFIRFFLPGTMDLISMEEDRFSWSLKTFPESTALSSIKKLESEIKEIEANINAGIKDPEEYADALMCLLDSAGRGGISPTEIIHAFAVKFEKNKSRKWVKNPDNSYSHVKQEGG